MDFFKNFAALTGVSRTLYRLVKMIAPLYIVKFFDLNSSVSCTGQTFDCVYDNSNISKNNKIDRVVDYIL